MKPARSSRSTGMPVLTDYQPGQKVWVFEPVFPRALQDMWSGSQIIKEKKGEVTYLVDLGTPRSPHRVLHEQVKTLPRQR